jgi:hypothetical protein
MARAMNGQMNSATPSPKQDAAMSIARLTNLTLMGGIVPFDTYAMLIATMRRKRSHCL